LLADALGSTRLVLDGLGNVKERLDYLPFGEELTAGIGGRAAPYSGGVYPNGPDIENQKFTGKERDAETGLDYFGARYFSGAMGRFVTPDWSEAPEAVVSADLRDPQTLNLYTYGRNNPLRNLDVDGHFWAELKNWFQYGHFVDDAHLEDALASDAALYRGTLQKQGALINGQSSDDYLRGRSNKEVVDIGRDFEYRLAADQVPAVPSPGVRSSVNRDPGLTRFAEEAGKNQDVQRSLDDIVEKLGKGNLSPGTGTRPVFGNILEARAANGARVYFRVGRDGGVEVLAKSSKANQPQVIQRLKEIYGK
jgi:RHS repeat-associated protein